MTDARKHLRSVIERIERLEEERIVLSQDVKEVYSEAKSNGFDVKILREIVRLRRIESSEREETAAMIDLYMSALGMKAPELYEHPSVTLPIGMGL